MSIFRITGLNPGEEWKHNHYQSQAWYGVSTECTVDMNLCLKSARHEDQESLVASSGFRQALGAQPASYLMSGRAWFLRDVMAG